MCYAKPGPRCDRVAIANLEQAQIEYTKNPSPENEAKLLEKQEEFAVTHKNISQLKQDGNLEEAEYFSALRSQMIEDANLIKQRTSGKWGNVSLKEMDPSALTHAINEIINDPKNQIDWGTSSSEDFNDAMMYASFLHRDQTRANRAGFPRTPYIEHPLRNTLRLLRWGCKDGEVLTASLLHDTVEDCADKIANSDQELTKSQERAIALQKMEDRYGANVTRILHGVSNDLVPKNMPREKKVEKYLQHLEKVTSDPQIFLVKIVDLYDNAGGLHHNLIPGQEKMVKNLHRKYWASMKIVSHSYENVKDDLHSINISHLETKINNIIRNLHHLGKDLESLQ